MTDSSPKIIKFFFDYFADSPIWDDAGRLLGCKALGLSQELSSDLEALAREYDLNFPPDIEPDDLMSEDFDRRSDFALNRLIAETEPKGYWILVYAGPEKGWISAREYLAIDIPIPSRDIA